MKLNLTKPLAFFDLETTGVDVATDRIVEIAILKVAVDNTQQIKTWRINPTIPIPVESSKIHGIYDKDVKDSPTFKETASEIAAFIGNSDLGGYNSNKFDIPLLVEEFMRVDFDFTMKDRRSIDVQNIFHKMEQRTLSAAVKFYCNKEMENAHNAAADIAATFDVFAAQLERYKDTVVKDTKGNETIPVKNDMNVLHEFTRVNNWADLAGRLIYNEQGQELFNFGKHKGKLVTEVFKSEPSYYSWMMQGDFPLYTKKVLTEIKLRGAFGK